LTLTEMTVLRFVGTGRSSDIATVVSQSHKT